MKERQEERLHPPHIRGRPWRGWMFLSFFLCAKEIRVFLVRSALPLSTEGTKEGGGGVVVESVNPPGINSIMKNIMMNMKHILITILLLLGATNIFAQSDANTRKDSLYRQEVREMIALDYSMPDYSVKKIDESKLGSRLASLLRYLEENQKNGYINPWIASVVKEQNESLREKYIEVEKLKLVSVSKAGDVISIKYKASLSAKIDNSEPVFLIIHFLDGVSESKNVNDLFSYISRYVTAREQLNK